jgi:regulatory protein
MARSKRPWTERSLERSAIHYLERYAAPRVHLRRVLVTKLRRRANEERVDLAEAMTWLDPLLDRLEASGLLNDAKFARDRAARLHRQGSAPRLIRAKLAQKGVTGEVVDQALAALGDEAELMAAASYARRRKLGTWGDGNPDHRSRDLARMGRRGFGYDVSRRVLEADEDERLRWGIGAILPNV